jgi:hypothetical protein
MPGISGWGNFDWRGGQLLKVEVNFHRQDHERGMRISRARLAYSRLVDEWRSIVDRPLSKEAKQAECMAVLREFIDSVAWKRIRGTNRPLRFYADMLALQQLLRPTMATDELGEVAIRPAYRLVNDWLEEHSVT